MSSTSQKTGPKMCKSPKNSAIYQNIKADKIIMNEYENLSTNCTVVGSNNLHLVKKPQMLTSLSPAYSNPSPGYPPSPASLKSPSPSLKPPTPQPSFPVMQIIHNSPLVARPIQNSQPQNIIKLKPHLNILPKPSASPQPSPKPSVSPQIVIPTNQQATIMPTAQPLLLNQMPVITPGVQFILRPQPTKIPTQMQTATPQGLILQPGGQQLLQLQPPRSQPMVRVLTNGVQLAPPTTTYVTHLTTQPQQANVVNTVSSGGCSPKKKPKKKKQKLDLANIMKLSGIGDEDDIQFESDTSQSESEPNLVQTPQPQIIQQQANIVQSASNLVQTSEAAKKIGNIHISTMAQPTINATAAPLLQVLNQNFQSGMLSNNTSQAAAAQASIPFNPFITPNFTINNGLMVQRSGGFKLTVGEDGRLVLQHDPTLNQDLQSQLLLQSIFGLNGGLVLQPSMDQQVHSQTVQTIQQQSVQTIQQQTVQSQTIQTVQQQTVQPQTVQHQLQAIQPQMQTMQPQTVQQTVQQTIQHQTVQSALQPHPQPMQIVQPQPMQPQLHQQLQSQIQSLLQQSQPMQQQQRGVSQPQAVHSQTQPVLKVQPFQKSQPPVHAVHPQPIQAVHHHHPINESPQPQQQQQQQPTSYVVNLTPDQLEQLKRNGQLTVNGQTIYMQRPANKTSETVVNNSAEIKNKQTSPKIKAVKRVGKVQTTNAKPILQDNATVKEAKPVSLLSALQAPPKQILQQNHVQSQAKHAPQIVNKLPEVQKVQQGSQTHAPPPPPQNRQNAEDVEKLLGQLLEDNPPVAVANSNAPTQQPQQRVHTIQLTPQKQQHLKSIQLQIQTLSARLTPGDTDMQNALKLLFAEQQKILASGKVLPPAIYHNNQLTIVNPSSLSLPQQQPVKGECAAHVERNAAPARGVCVETAPVTHQTAPTQPQAPRVTVSDHSVQHHSVPVTNPPPLAVPRFPTIVQQQHPVPSPPQQTRCIPSYTKEQLIEQQLNTDQNGAVKPDIHTPFKDKVDACKRLIRYHCFDQPVLSQKDLNKADEIFELTAKHFIDKFSRMVDKYRYLLLKESMRQVQTSELMMLDRMFLAEEQQSIVRLRQDLDETPPVRFSPPPAPPCATQPAAAQHDQDEYDEWACIQRELGCLQEEPKQPPKRSASSDSRLETLKRFRVERKKCGEGASGAAQPKTQQNCDSSGQSCAGKAGVAQQQQQQPASELENNSIDEQVQSAIDSILNLQQNTSLDLDDAVSSILS